MPLERLKGEICIYCNQPLKTTQCTCRAKGYYVRPLFPGDHGHGLPSVHTDKVKDQVEMNKFFRKNLFMLKPLFNEAVTKFEGTHEVAYCDVGAFGCTVGDTTIPFQLPRYNGHQAHPLRRLLVVLV